MSRVTKNLAFAYAKTKTQISFAVTVKLISAFVFAIRIVQSLNYLTYIRNFKPLSIFCGCTARFVSDQVRNPEDRYKKLMYNNIMRKPVTCTYVNKNNKGVCQIWDTIFLWLGSLTIKPSAEDSSVISWGSCWGHLGLLYMYDPLPYSPEIFWQLQHPKDQLQIIWLVQMPLCRTCFSATVQTCQYCSLNDHNCFVTYYNLYWHRTIQPWVTDRNSVTLMSEL